MKEIKRLMVYIPSDYVRDTQFIKHSDEAVRLYCDKECESFNDLEILWENCNPGDLVGASSLLVSKKWISKEEAIRTIFSYSDIFGIRIELEFFDGEEKTELTLDEALEEIKRQHQKQKANIEEFFDSKIKYVNSVKEFIEHYKLQDKFKEIYGLKDAEDGYYGNLGISDWEVINHMFAIKAEELGDYDLYEILDLSEGSNDFYQLRMFSCKWEAKDDI